MLQSSSVLQEITQESIIEDGLLMSHVVHGDLITKQRAYQLASGSDGSLLYSGDQKQLQQFAKWLDGRAFEPQVIAELQKFSADRGEGPRYVISLLIKAEHHAQNHLGLKIELGKDGNLDVAWSELDLRELPEIERERSSFDY